MSTFIFFIFSSHVLKFNFSKFLLFYIFFCIKEKRQRQKIQRFTRIEETIPVQQFQTNKKKKKTWHNNKEKIRNIPEYQNILYYFLCFCCCQEIKSIQTSFFLLFSPLLLIQNFIFIFCEWHFLSSFHFFNVNKHNFLVWGKEKGQKTDGARKRRSKIFLTQVQSDSSSSLYFIRMQNKEKKQVKNISFLSCVFET